MVTKGQFAAGWTPVGALQTGTGYEVAFKSTAEDSMWSGTPTATATYTSNATGILPGDSLELAGVEAAFGDGTFAGAG